MKIATLKLMAVLAIIFTANYLSAQSTIALTSTGGTDNQAICFNDNIIPITYSVGGDASGAFVSGLANGLTGIYAAGVFTISGTAAPGVYNYFITTSGGISPTSAAGTIIVNQLPFVSGGANQTVCDGQTIVLNGSGGITYAWDLGQMNSVPFIPTVGTTTYTVVGTDVNGCIASDQVNVTATPLPIISAGADQMVCEGTMVTLAGSGAVTYTWDNSIIDINPFYPSVGTTVFTVIGEDGNGCAASDQVSVTVDALSTPFFAAIPDVCLGDASPVLPFSSLNGIDGVWSPVVSTASAGTTNYTFTPNAGLCATNGTLTITVTNPITPTFGTIAPVCLNEPNVVLPTVSTDIPGITGTYSPAVQVGIAGTQTYTFSPALGQCAYPTTVQLTVLPLPTVFIGSNSPICEGTTLNLTATNAIGATYNWTGPNGFSDATQNPSISTASVLASGVYSLTTSAGGCIVDTSMVVEIIDSNFCAGTTLSGTVFPTGVSVNGQCDGSATLVLTGGQAPFNYLFSNGDTTLTAQDLCEGLNSVQIWSADGDSLSLTFIVPSPSNITTTLNYNDSLIMDSIYNQAINNCLVNYSNIDSAYISNFNILANDTILVTWNIVSNSTTVSVTDIYYMGSGTGVYTIVLGLFCPNKALGKYLTSYDQIYYNAAMAGLKAEEQETVTVYPNPFSDQVNIVLKTDDAAQVWIYDISGKVVFTDLFHSRKIQLDLPQLVAGQYLLKIQSASANYQLRISK